MSEHGSLQFVWDIMLQSEWWKQYSEMVERSLAEQAGEGNADLGFDAGSWSGSWTGSYSALLMSSGSRRAHPDPFVELMRWSLKRSLQRRETR